MVMVGWPRRPRETVEDFEKRVGDEWLLVDRQILGRNSVWTQSDKFAF